MAAGYTIAKSTGKAASDRDGYEGVRRRHCKRLVHGNSNTIPARQFRPDGRFFVCESGGEKGDNERGEKEGIKSALHRNIGMYGCRGFPLLYMLLKCFPRHNGSTRWEDRGNESPCQPDTHWRPLGLVKSTVEE
ncbi:hypothetical protein B0H16DRAFT_1461979 [Mycena metata]|uniref:Uncharacterized protein n=1 Tax=Mycena metata TaxID=1033252 RepID=A0AAD7N5L2_9AGAR|nr:hypothetical protein B0H16DRAFT_1461979 [Mycena metata]